MDGWINIGTRIDTKDFDAQVEYIKHRMEVIEKTLEGGGVATEDVLKLRQEYEKLGNKLKQIRKEQNSWIEDTQKGISKVIGKVAKWGLAVFGIRSVYLGLRQAMSTISQYNEDLANKIESIKTTLAFALEPIISAIVNLFYKLIQYAQYLIKVWTGYDIFASAKKNLSGANKEAQKLKKTMAGFDTANVLQDNGTVSTGGTGVGAISELEKADIPGWVKKIEKLGNITKDTISVIKVLIEDIVYVVGVVLSLITVAIVEAVTVIINIIRGMAQTCFSIGYSMASVLAGIFTTLVELIKAPVRMITDIFDSMIKGIIGLFGNLANTIIKLFKGDIPGALNSMKNAFKSVFNALWGIAKAPLNLIIDGVNAIIKGLNKISIKTPDWLGGKKWGINIPTIPRLATGGIINNPGRGVPVGAIAGESGREGVLPLTDSQAMQQLGQEIGKWISVNVDLTTKLDGRVLSRSLEQIKSNNSFIRNGV